MNGTVKKSILQGQRKLLNEQGHLNEQTSVGPTKYVHTDGLMYTIQETVSATDFLLMFRSAGYNTI